MSRSLIVSCAVGVLSALFMMGLAWQHNPQGEIHTEDGINWPYWLLIGFSWLFVTFSVSSLFGVFITKIFTPRIQ